MEQLTLELEDSKNENKELKEAELYAKTNNFKPGGVDDISKLNLGYRRITQVDSRKIVFIILIFLWSLITILSKLN